MEEMDFVDLCKRQGELSEAYMKQQKLKNKLKMELAIQQQLQQEE